MNVWLNSQKCCDDQYENIYVGLEPSRLQFWCLAIEEDKKLPKLWWWNSLTYLKVFSEPCMIIDFQNFKYMIANNIEMVIFKWFFLIFLFFNLHLVSICDSHGRNVNRLFILSDLIRSVFPSEMDSIPRFISPRNDTRGFYITSLHIISSEG